MADFLFFLLCGRPMIFWLSASVAALLDVKAGDRIKAYFVQQPPRVRVFTVKGIYDTGFKEYDDMTVLCDIRHLQRLNGWDAGQLTGVAIELEDIRLIPAVEEALDHVLAWNEDQDFYKITSLQEAAPQIFDWLNLLNLNVAVILTLIVIVAGFNMVSGFTDPDSGQNRNDWYPEGIGV